MVSIRLPRRMNSITLPRLRARTAEKVPKTNWRRVIFYDRAIGRSHVGLLPLEVLTQKLGAQAFTTSDSKIPYIAASLLGGVAALFIGLIIGLFLLFVSGWEVHAVVVFAVIVGMIGAGAGLPFAKPLTPPPYFIVRRELVEQPKLDEDGELVLDEDDEPVMEPSLAITPYMHSRFTQQEYYAYKYIRDDDGKIKGVEEVEDYEEADFFRKPTYTGALFAEASKGEDFKQEFRTPADRSGLMKLQLGMLALVLLGLAVIVYLMFANAMEAS